MDETLFGMASRLLALVESTFLSDGMTLPERRVVYPAPIPADCEQVAVLFTGWATFPGADGPEQCINMRWLADLSVIITRCTPALPKATRGGSTASPPDPQKMKDAAKIASDDAEGLLHVLQGVGEAGAVSLTTGAPQGGLQTVELNLQVPVGRL